MKSTYCLGVPEIRSPKKNYITCHTLNCLLYEQNASKKNISDKSTLMTIACVYHMFLLTLSLCFFLSFTQNIQPYTHPPTLFQINDCLTSLLVQEPEESVPEFPSQYPLWGRTPKAPGDNTSSTPATGQHGKRLSHPHRGRAGMLCTLSIIGITASKTKSFVQLI